jgi:hypothetical protein
MEKIYSKVNPGVLLHVIFRMDDFKEGRTEIIDGDEFIQCSALLLDYGHTFRPHKHNMQHRVYSDYVPQESWIVITGKVKCTFYDLDDTIIAEPELGMGDASFTLRGGHTYTIMMPHTFVLEYKTGRYFGQKNDKTFLDESD